MTGFEWDPFKAAVNLLKHGVSFEEATDAFDDVAGLILPDADHDAVEERFVLIGLSKAPRLLVVVHCERKGGEVVRIISARRANSWEERLYSERRGS